MLISQSALGHRTCLMFACRRTVGKELVRNLLKYLKDSWIGSTSIDQDYRPKLFAIGDLAPEVSEVLLLQIYYKSIMFKLGTPYKRRGPSVKPRHVKLQVQHARKREEHTGTTKKFLDSDAGQWTCFWIASACPHDKACGMARDEVMDKTVKIRLPDVDKINGYPQLLEKKRARARGSVS